MKKKNYSHVAQLVEHLTLNQRVAGSNPVVGTKIKSKKGMRGLDAAFKVILKNVFRLFYNLIF